MDKWSKIDSGFAPVYKKPNFDVIFCLSAGFRFWILKSRASFDLTKQGLSQLGHFASIAACRLFGNSDSVLSIGYVRTNFYLGEIVFEIVIESETFSFKKTKCHLQDDGHLVSASMY